MWFVQLELCKICVDLGLLELLRRLQLASAEWAARWFQCIARVAWVTEWTHLASVGWVSMGSDQSGTPGTSSIKCEYLACNLQLSSTSA